MLFYALICWETQGVKLHFRWENTSLSQKQGSPLFQQLSRESCQKTNNGGATLHFHSCTASSVVPVGEVQSSHQTALTILCPVTAVGMELILQTKTCSFHKESNFQLYPVTRLFSSCEKGHLLPNLQHWSWIVTKRENNNCINNPVWGYLIKRRKCWLF